MKLQLLVMGMLAVPASASEWTTLFGGDSLAGWRTPVGKVAAEDCWRIEEGTLRPVRGLLQADLWSSKVFRDFELEFEFRLDPGANGGIKYLVQRGGAGIFRQGKWLPAAETEMQPGDRYSEGTGGLEFQIVDDAGQEAKDPKRRSGAIYSLVAPVDPPPVGPGEFHRGRIVVRGDHIEHHLDGRKVVDVTLGSPEMEAAWTECKRSDIQRLRGMEKREGPVAITHHGSAVRYRNVRIRALE